MNRNYALLRKCGRMLYGNNWKKPLAYQLNVRSNRIDKWQIDTIPPGVWLEISELLKQRKADIEQALDDIA